MKKILETGGLLDVDIQKEAGKGFTWYCNDGRRRKSYLHVNNGPNHSIEIKGKVFLLFYNNFSFRICFSFFHFFFVSTCWGKVALRINDNGWTIIVGYYLIKNCWSSVSNMLLSWAESCCSREGETFHDKLNTFMYH